MGRIKNKRRFIRSRLKSKMRCSESWKGIRRKIDFDYMRDFMLKVNDRLNIKDKRLRR